MSLNKTIILLFTVMLSFSIQAQNIKTEIIRLEKELDNPLLEYKINEYLKHFDTLSVPEMKAILKEGALERPKEREKFIIDYDEHLKYKTHLIDSLTRHYNPDEEKFDAFPPRKLVTKNHLTFKKIMQNEIFLKQEYENNHSRISLVTNDKFSITKKTKNGTIHESMIGTHDQLKIHINKIYYHDSTDNKQYHVGKLNQYLFEHTVSNRRVDSIKMNFNLEYLSKIDSVKFTKNDIGKEKKGIKLISMKDNVVMYLTSRSNSYKTPDMILEEIAINKEHKLLAGEISTYINHLSAEKEYANRVSIFIKKYEKTKNMNNRKDIYTMLKYLILKNTIFNKRKKSLYEKVYKGNVNAITFIIAKKRDSINFDVTIKNKLPQQEYYLSYGNGHTQFIDNNGKILYETAGRLHPVSSKELGLTSDKYFYTVSNYAKTYYYIDLKKKLFEKLLFKVNYLTPSLMVVQNKNYTKALRNTFQNINLTRLFHSVNFEGDNIYLTDQRDYYYYIIFDQDGKIITTKTKKDITKIKIRRVRD